MKQIKDYKMKILNKIAKCKQWIIRIVMVRFLKQVDTCNGNGHALWILKWNIFGWKGRWWFYTKKIGDGDNGDRCMM